MGKLRNLLVYPFSFTLISFNFNFLLQLVHNVVQIDEIVAGLGRVKEKPERDLQAMEVRRKASEDDVS